MHKHYWYALVDDSLNVVYYQHLIAVATFKLSALICIDKIEMFEWNFDFISLQVS